MAAALFPEPDGGRDRWFPLGDPGRQHAALLARLFSITIFGSGDTGHRDLLLPQDGKNLCGRDLMSSVITVENLSKKYIIGHQKQAGYTNLRDVLANGVKRFTHKLTHPFAAPVNDPTHEEFWALKDVSFDIQQGDRVGIIGRNGAGKSTLLKILSRITEPTSGKVSIRGRVASLLEVGTGFHPELSGRENIYLNGAILGMSKVEIKSKFDEIVAFAEVEKFLDTPV